jgi:ABC-type transport system involved in multi-copper enzyme maturation permease subunit
VDDLAPVDPGPLALALLGSYLCFLATGGVALLVASLVRTGGRVVGWAAGFLIVSYAIDYLAQIWSVAEPLGPLSVFRYLDPPAVLRTGALGWEDVAALGGIAAVTIAAALVLIGRRDLTP